MKQNDIIRLIQIVWVCRDVVYLYALQR